MIDWSTDSIRERERFSFWRESDLQIGAHVSTEFGARAVLRAHDRPQLRQTSFCRRSIAPVMNSCAARQQVARMPEDYYVVTLHLHGRSQFSQGDEAVALEPNEIAIVDGMRPFRIAFMEPVQRASAVIPHAMIDRRAPWLRSGPRRKIAANSPFADLIRRHLLQLAGSGLALERNRGDGANGQSVQSSGAGDGARRDARPPAARTHARGGAGLLPAGADTIRSSRRRAWPRISASRCARCIRGSTGADKASAAGCLENRLEACGNALRNPHFRNDSVSEIAYRWGFNDLSHFNRAFRSRFGIPPRQWRTLRQL